MASGTSRSGTRTPCRVDGRTSMSATGSAPQVRWLIRRRSAPINASISRMPVRVGLTPTPWIVNGSARADAGGDDEERRRRDVARHTDARRLQLPRRPNRRDPAAGAHFAPEALQHALGVVARDGGFLDRRLALGVEPGEQHGGLHLRARDRHRVTDAVQLRTAGDADRRLAVERLDPRPHLPQRLRDPFHRTPHQRLVADQLANRTAAPTAVP